MRILLVMPILIPLFSAVICVLIWGRLRAQQGLTLLSSIGLLSVSVALLVLIDRSGMAAVQMGNWPAPFGITLVADRLSAIMLTATSVIAVVGTIYSIASVDLTRQTSGYYPLLNLLMMGTSGALLTGDVFNLYVWVELLLISSFVLLALGGERAQLEGALKYVLLNMLGSFLLLGGTGLLYGLSGTLNMADLAVRLRSADGTLVTVVAMMFLVALGIKSAVFPLFFWLPASYHTPPVAVTAIFSGLLTKVGIYAMVRLFTLLFVVDVAFTHALLLVLAGLTMVSGVLGAVAQDDMRRLLAFHIVSQIGYMLMGLGLFSSLALAATIYFTVHIIFTKTALFFVSGAAHRLLGSYDLKRIGGLYRDRPLLAAGFLVPALSLAGLPPLSGFIAKLALVQAGLAMQQYAIVITALAVSILTLYSMMKIWTLAFWKPAPEGQKVLVSTSGGVGFLAPIFLLTGLTVAMGVAAGPVFALCQRAADQLVDPAAYINVVLHPSNK